MLRGYRSHRSPRSNALADPDGVRSGDIDRDIDINIDRDIDINIDRDIDINIDRDIDSDHTATATATATATRVAHSRAHR